MLFSSNNRTIPAPLPELQIIFFSYVSPLSISLCYLLLHILMRKQGRESRASLLEFSARTVQNSEKGRDSQASLLEFSTQMAGNSEKGRDFRGCFLRISTQTTQIGKIGRDSRGCLLEFSTQMAQNSEKGRDFRGCLLGISTQTAQIGKIGRDSKFRRPLSCFHAPINRYPNYNMFLFPLLSSRIIYCYS